MQNKKSYLCLLFFILLLCSCKTAEEEFIGRRLLTLCDEAYSICHKTAGCILDKDRYVEGIFPGTHRVVIDTEETETDFSVRIYFSKMGSPGTELLIQFYEPDCSLDTTFARAHLIDVDLFEKSGDDRALIFDLKVLQEGEHLLEIFSDASAEYLLIVEPK